MAGENMNYPQPCLNFSNCSTHYLLVVVFLFSEFSTHICTDQYWAKNSGVPLTAHSPTLSPSFPPLKIFRNTTCSQKNAVINIPPRVFVSAYFLVFMPIIMIANLKTLAMERQQSE